MPDAIGALADGEHDGLICCIMSHGHGVVLIGAKPGVAAIESTTHVAFVVVEHYVFAIYPASESGRSNLYFGGFMAWKPLVGDGDPPEHDGFEAVRRRDGAHIACFVTHLIGNSRIIGDDEGGWTGSAASGCDHCDCGADTPLRDERDDLFG